MRERQWVALGSGRAAKRGGIASRWRRRATAPMQNSIPSARPTRWPSSGGTGPHWLGTALAPVTFSSRLVWRSLDARATSGQLGTNHFPSPLQQAAIPGGGSEAGGAYNRPVLQFWNGVRCAIARRAPDGTANSRMESPSTASMNTSGWIGTRQGESLDNLSIELRFNIDYRVVNYQYDNNHMLLYLYG